MPCNEGALRDADSGAQDADWPLCMAPLVLRSFSVARCNVVARLGAQVHRWHLRSLLGAVPLRAQPKLRASSFRSLARRRRLTASPTLLGRGVRGPARASPIR